jgi:hypothetical protein
MKAISQLMFIFTGSLAIAACSPHSDNERHATEHEKEHQVQLANIAELFNKSSTKVAPELVSCTLSGGTKTDCFSVTVTSLQTEHKTGPWCPRNISDGPEKSGIWLDKGKVYDADGQFIENLAEFYKDNEWELFNPETGEIKVTDSKEACMAAARPDVAEEYQNYCVECQPSYADENQQVTYLIPAHPVPLDKAQRMNPHSGIGIAFNGVKFDAPAPVEAILGAHTLAPFDDCGGHVNTHVGYHYHAVTGCTKEVETLVDHAPAIGYAMDGFMIYSRLNGKLIEPTDLDSCRGHITDGIGYHYHANDVGKNQIIGCFQAEQGCAVESAIEGDNQSCQVSGRRPPPPRRPD